jgi:histidinol-phosphatase (PHP family)
MNKILANNPSQKMKIDVHTHSTFSLDGISSLTDMLETAYQKGIQYYGVAEHFNADYLDTINHFFQKMDVAEYFRFGRELQEKYAKEMSVAIGAEFGFAEDEKAHRTYQALIDTYHPDFVVNSIHSFGGVDYAFLKKVLPPHDSCTSYLQLVRKSLEAPYHYDIVAHIGYVLRYIENGDATVFFNTYREQLRDILQTVIDKDKILEVNTSSYGLPQATIPDEQILSLYYELGGRKISFGSDAHAVDRVGDKFDEVVSLLKSIGFEHFTVPFRGEHIQISL